MSMDPSLPTVNNWKFTELTVINISWEPG